MSWNIGFAAPSKGDAKSELKKRNKDAGMPAAAEKAVAALITALPPTDLPGFDAVSVSASGHLRGKKDAPGGSFMSVQVQWAANAPLARGGGEA